MGRTFLLLALSATLLAATALPPSAGASGSADPWVCRQVHVDHDLLKLYVEVCTRDLGARVDVGAMVCEPNLLDNCVGAGVRAGALPVEIRICVLTDKDEPPLCPIALP